MANYLLSGLVGRKGDTGSPGLAGPKGEPGRAGLKGDPGVNGMWCFDIDLKVMSLENPVCWRYLY